MNTFQEDAYRVDRDIILIGDFNVTSFKPGQYEAITEYGLSAPKSLPGPKLAKDKPYDQILHHPTIWPRFYSSTSTARAGTAAM